MCTLIGFFLVMTRYYYLLSVQGYIHSVFNLIVDILMPGHDPCYGQLHSSKRVSALPVSHDLIATH